MADISFNIARKELKIAQIAQIYQLFRLLHLIHTYGHGVYKLSCMLMRKNVNNDVSKDSPIQKLNAFYHKQATTIKYYLPLREGGPEALPCIRHC